MSMTTLAWLGMAAYAMHILEEYTLNWRDWARNVLHLPAEWNDFYVTNGIVVALGIVQAMLASTLPLAALGWAGLMFINAVLMHVTPFVHTGGRFSPGLLTALLLFLPVSVATFATGLATGVASPVDVGLGLAIGGATLAFPIIMLIVRSRPYFQQDRA